MSCIKMLNAFTIKEQNSETCIWYINIHTLCINLYGVMHLLNIVISKFWKNFFKIVGIEK